MSESSSPQLSRTQLVAFVASMVFLNLVVGATVSLVKLPLYLDSIGIVLAAVFLNWRWAAITGLATALIGTLVINPFLFYYSATGVLIGIVAAMLARRGLFRHVATTVLAGIIIGLVAAVASAPVTALVFGGVTASGADVFTALFTQVVDNLLYAAFLGGVSSDPVDKVLVCLVVLALCRSLPRRILLRFPNALQALGLGGPDNESAATPLP